MNYKLIEDIELEINGTYPDFTDSYIVNANYDGKEMSDKMLDELNEDSQFIYDLVLDWVL